MALQCFLENLMSKSLQNIGGGLQFPTGLVDTNIELILFSTALDVELVMGIYIGYLFEMRLRKCSHHLCQHQKQMADFLKFHWWERLPQQQNRLVSSY